MNSFTASKSTIASRRNFLTRAGSGLGAIALIDLLNASRSPAYAATTTNPLAPKTPHHPPRAKSIIFLFMEGGPSHLDLFDPKPALDKLAGKPMPESFGRPLTSMGTETTRSCRPGANGRNMVRADCGFPTGTRT